MPKYLKAKVAQVFTRPVGTNRQTGEKYGGDRRIQLIDEVVMPNGETQLELITMSIPENLHVEVGEVVDIPVKIFGKASLIYDGGSKNVSQ
jgi:hypothetical protein